MAASSTSPPLTLESFSFYLNKNITDVTSDLLAKAPAEADFIARRQGTSEWFQILQNFGGIGRPTLNRDLEKPPQVIPIAGYQSAITMKSYRAQLTVEETMTRVSKWADKVTMGMRRMAQSVSSMKDAITFNFINNGFTNGTAGNIVESDGTARALFSTGHVYESGSGSWSNYYNVGVPPNPETVFLLIQQYLGTLKDETGANFIGFDGEFTIITPKSRPDWGLAADELVASLDRPDTTNRSTNVLNSANPRTSVSFTLRHRSANNLTSNTKWFIVASPMNSFYPLLLLELIPYELTPLEKIGPANPHCWVQTVRTQFSPGFNTGYRGMVAAGT